MNHKRSNLLFFILILLDMVTVLVLTRFPQIRENSSDAVNLMRGELNIAIVAGVFALVLGLRKEITFSETFRFKKIRIVSVFSIILYAFLLLPMMTLLNAITMLFTSNAMLDASGKILNNPWYVIVIGVGVLTPFCEEMTYRGLIFGGLKKGKNTLAAVFLSALMFGLMHMNINQAVYAFAIGVFMAIACLAVDSLWGSIIIHMVINLQNSIIMVVEDKFYPDIFELAKTSLTNDVLYLTISFYMVIALVCTALALALIYWVAKYEGNREAITDLFAAKGTQLQNGGLKDLITAPLVVAVIICVFYMFWNL